MIVGEVSESDTDTWYKKLEKVYSKHNMSYGCIVFWSTESTKADKPDLILPLNLELMFYVQLLETLPVGMLKIHHSHKIASESFLRVFHNAIRKKGI